MNQIIYLKDLYKVKGLKMIIRGQITKGKLEIIYKTIQDIIPEEDCYYTEEEFQEIKKDKNNIFIDKQGGVIMTDKELIENLCMLQDLNKNLRFNSTSEEQLKQCERVEENIQKQFKKINVN